MRVISGPDKWTKQVTCKARGCGSVLELEAADVKPGAFGANYGGDSPELKFYVECPSCAHPVFIDTSDLPRAVYDAGIAWWRGRKP